MANYPITGSSLSGRISTGLSTQIVVKVDNVPVGAIQKLTISQTRSINQVVELGLDGILELVPNKATTYKISVTRIVFDKKRLPEAFLRGFINIKSQMVPFDIDIIDNSIGEGGVVHTLKNCWFESYNPDYSADNFIISEQAGLACEDIATVFGGSDKAAANNGQLPEYINGNTGEQNADAGKRRGTMDYMGIYQITQDIFGQ